MYQFVKLCLVSDMSNAIVGGIDIDFSVVIDVEKSSLVSIYVRGTFWTGLTQGQGPQNGYRKPLDLA